MARLGGAVERCHGIPHHGSYSNSSHQWGVAILMNYLWPEDFPRLALACLTHDVPEAWVGDIPAPTLRYMPGVKQTVGMVESAIFKYLELPDEQALPDEDYDKLKACDRLDLYLWAVEQGLLGNLYARSVIDELEVYFETNPLPEPADRLLMEIKLLYAGPTPSHGVVRELSRKVFGE